MSLSLQTIQGIPQHAPAHTKVNTSHMPGLSCFSKINKMKVMFWSNRMAKKKKIITSLKKSPCFLSSASIALSRIPPAVALERAGKGN